MLPERDRRQDQVLEPGPETLFAIAACNPGPEANRGCSANHVGQHVADRRRPGTEKPNTAKAMTSRSIHDACLPGRDRTPSGTATVIEKMRVTIISDNVGLDPLTDQGLVTGQRW